MKNTSDFDGALVDYKAKGNTIELVGKEKLDTKDVYHLKVTMKGGQVQHYFLDADQRDRTQEVGRDRDGTRRQKQTLETEMTNYSRSRASWSLAPSSS